MCKIKRQGRCVRFTEEVANNGWRLRHSKILCMSQQEEQPLFGVSLEVETEKRPTAEKLNQLAERWIDICPGSSVE